MDAGAPHLLFLTRTAYTLGGAATWLDYLEPALRARGWRVTVGLVEGPVFHRPERYLVQHPHQNWVRIPSLTATEQGRRQALRQAIAALTPDVVVSMNVADAVAVIAAERAMGYETPRIAISAQMIDEGLLHDIAAFAPVLDAVVCTNALTRQLAIQLSGMPPERVWHGPYGVPMPAAVPPATAPARLQICYVGRLDEPDKRVYDIPRILATLDTCAVPFQITIIGTGPDEAALRQRMAPWIANGAARFLGRLAPADIWSQVNPGHGVLLLTSWTDTGPFVVFEAMAWQLAVVSSRYYGSGLDQALRHGDTAMLFPIGDATAAAHCLRQLWQDPALHHHLIAQGAQLVRERYSLAHSIAAWDGIFRGIVEAPLRPVGQALAPARMEARLACCALQDPDHDVRVPDEEEPMEDDEWPLTLARVPQNNPRFWAYVAKVDRHSLPRGRDASKEPIRSG